MKWKESESWTFLLQDFESSVKIYSTHKIFWIFFLIQISLEIDGISNYVYYHILANRIAYETKICSFTFQNASHPIDHIQHLTTDTTDSDNSSTGRFAPNGPTQAEISHFFLKAHFSNGIVVSYRPIPRIFSLFGCLRNPNKYSISQFKPVEPVEPVSECSF